MDLDLIEINLPPAVQSDIRRLKSLISQADALPICSSVIRGSELGYDRHGFLGQIPTSETYHYREESPTLMWRLEQAIRDIAPNSAYVDALGQSASTAARADVARGLLADLKDGFIDNRSALAHAEVFTDLLEMAEHLLEREYRVAAAVIGGSVVEVHLKKLAAAYKVDACTPDGKHKAAAIINDELAKKSAYDLTTKKYLTAWQGLRNDAAHGQKSNAELDKGEVQLMLAGVRNFIRSHPA